MRLLRVGLVVGSFVACVGDTNNDGGTDAQSDVTTADVAPNSDGGQDGAIEADAAPMVCDVMAKFTSSAIVKNVNSTTHEYSATLMPDEKTIFFSTFSNFTDGGAIVESIFTSTRSSPTADFATPTLAQGVNINNQQMGDPTILPDGNTLYVASFTPGLSWDIYVTQRSSPQAVFPTPQVVANVNFNTTDVRPAIRADGKELIFMGDHLNPTTRYLLYRSTMTGSSFGAATEITELESVGGGSKSIGSPVLSVDGLTLYFNVFGTTTNEVWIARRATVNDPFGAAAAVTEVNVNGAAAPAWLSPDNCRLYVSQIANDGGASFDLYVYSR